MPTRHERLQAVLAAHPSGLVIEEVLRRVGEPEERTLLLQSLRLMCLAGEATVTGKERRNRIASALVRPATPS